MHLTRIRRLGLSYSMLRKVIQASNLAIMSLSVLYSIEIYEMFTHEQTLP